MARLEWNTQGKRQYEAGVDRGVLYIEGQAGVTWTGLTSVEMTPIGGGSKSYYLDGNKYLLVSTAEEFGATINAYTYPEQFGTCDGSVSVRSGLSIGNQRRKTFGFSYRTMVGSDLNGDLGYKIHLVYNALAEPSQRSYSAIGDSVDPIEFSWSITTKAPIIPGYKRTSHIEIDSRTTDIQVMELIESVLYGNDENAARLPTFAELVEMYDAFFVFVVTDNGDRTYTISGPDEAIEAIGEDYLVFDWPTVIPVDANTYTISDG